MKCPSILPRTVFPLRELPARLHISAWSFPFLGLTDDLSSFQLRLFLLKMKKRGMVISSVILLGFADRTNMAGK